MLVLLKILLASTKGLQRKTEKSKDPSKISQLGTGILMPTWSLQRALHRKKTCAKYVGEIPQYSDSEHNPK